MLFPPKSVFDTRARILRDLDSGKLPAATAYQHLIQLDPEDIFALLLLAEYRKGQGNDAGEEELLWKALELQPGFGNVYRLLSDNARRKGQEGLAEATGDLWAQKQIPENAGDDDLLDDVDLSGDALSRDDWGEDDLDDDDVEEDASERSVEILPEAVKAETNAQSGDSLQPQPLQNERPEITAKLHPFRLVARIQNSADLQREFVDQLLSEREQIAPLLVGLLRGWARDLIEDSAAMVENVLALLGEIGLVKTLPPLVEFSDIDDQEIAGSAKWAIRRMIAQDPQESRDTLLDVAKDLSAGQRLVLIDVLTRDRTIDPSGDLFRELLTNGAERLSKKECDVFVPLAIGAILSTHGKNATPTAKALLRSRSTLLSKNAKREAEYLIDELGDQLPEPLAKEEDASPYTIYDICSGEAVWETDDEDEDEEGFVPSPVVRSAVPGRNDECWCGSGKKYKKCHLESDQSSSGTPR